MSSSTSVVVPRVADDNVLHSTFVITPEQTAVSAFAVGVNHLSLGQVEAVFALMRGCGALADDGVASHAAGGPAVVGTALKRLVRSFMRRYAASGSVASPVARVTPQHQQQDNDTTSSRVDASDVSLGSTFRVISSSIAPCMESLVYAVANTPGASDVKVWWDDELVVLVNVLIHATANMFHSPHDVHSSNSDASKVNVADQRNELLQAFDFLLEHDPAQFGDLSFATFTSIIEVFDSVRERARAHHLAASRSRRTSAAMEEPADVTADPPSFDENVNSLVDVLAFDSLLRSIWALIRCFFSQSSYAEFFSDCGESWADNITPGSAATASFVLRVLAIATDPPPDPEESRRAYQKRLELRQQRVEDSMKNLSSRDAPVTFTRASYLKATSESRRNLSHTLAEQDSQQKSRQLSEELIPSTLFCQLYVASAECSLGFEVLLLQTCSPRPELHRFVEAFAKYASDVAFVPDYNTLPCNIMVPLHQPEVLHKYTAALLSKATNPERCDAMTYSIQHVVDFIVAPAPAAVAQHQLQPQVRPHQSLFTSIRGFFQGSAGIEMLKPFVCLELYGRKLNRERFRSAQNKLSLHDHELLVDVLTTKDGSGGVSLIPPGHPCRPFVAGLRVCLRVAQVLHDKQPQENDTIPASSSTASPSTGHGLLLNLLDSQCNIVDHMLAHVMAPSPAASSSPSSDQPSLSGGGAVDTRSITALLRDTASILASAVGGDSTANSSNELCEGLALSISQQRLMLDAIAVIQWVAESPVRCASDTGDQSSDSSSRNGNEEDGPSSPSASGVFSTTNAAPLEDFLQQFSTTAAHVAQQINRTFLVLLSEALVELVVSMAAQVHLIPHLNPTQLQSKASPSSATSTAALGATQKVQRVGGSGASVASTALTSSPPRDAGAASPGRFTTSAPPLPPKVISSAERKKSLQAFCSIVTQLTKHLHTFLSPDVQTLLQDVVFRAAHAENAQCPERALIDAATSALTSRKGKSYSTFAQSPFRFLLEASLNQASAATDMGEVLHHLFVLTEGGGAAASTHLHPTLLFTFVSARLRAIREGRLSLSSFLHHIDVLYDVLERHSHGRSTKAKLSAHPDSVAALGVPRLRLEELWFHSPSTVEQLLEVDSSFVRQYQQSVLRNDSAATAVEIRAVSKRFEDVMASLGVHAPSAEAAGGLREALRDQSSFRRYLSAVDNIRCPVSAVQNYLRQLDRLSRVASSASATADDLMPLLGSLTASIGAEGDSPSSVWNPVFRRSTFDKSPKKGADGDPTPMNTPIQVVELIGRVKQFSDLVQQVAGVQAALPDLVRHGHDVLFEAIHLGNMPAGRLEHLLRGTTTGDEASNVAFLRNVLLRILLTEHCTTLQGQGTAQLPAYAPSSQLRIASAVGVALQNPTAAALFLFLYCCHETVDKVLEADATWFGENRVPTWIQRWLTQHHNTLRILDGAMDPSEASSQCNVVQRSVQRAHYFFSPEARFQSIAEVLLLQCSVDSRNDAVLRELCEALPMDLLLASLHHISDPEKALTVHTTVLDTLLQHMTTLRAHQVLKFSGDTAAAASATNTNARSTDIPETWCHLVEEVLFSCVPAPTIAAAFVGNLQPQHQESVLARHPVRTLLPLRAQKRILQRVLRQVAVELHCDPEDTDHRDLSLAVAERLEQLAVFTSMQDSVSQLVPVGSQSALPACIRLLLLDPIPVELVVNQATVTDEALRRTLHEAKGISPRDGLTIRVKHLSLVRSNTNSEDAQALAIRSLCERYCELLLLSLDPAASQSSTDVAEFTFIKDLSTMIRSEIATSPKTAPALIQRLVDKLLATPTLSTALLFRVVRFVTESTMTKAIFAGHERWVRVCTGLHALNALITFDNCNTTSAAATGKGSGRRSSSALPPSSATSSTVQSPNTASQREDDGDGETSNSASGTFDGDAPFRLQSLFGRPFLSQPLLVVENLLMMQRVSAAAAVLLTFKDPKLRKECDKLLLRYARMSVDMTRFLTVTGKRFPYGKELTDDPRRTNPPLSIPTITTLTLAADDDDATLAAKRKAFQYTNTPHLPLFRRLIELVDDQELMAECVGDFAIALFDSLYDSSENHVVRALIIDTAENILWALSQACGSQGDHNSPDRPQSQKSGAGAGGPHCPTEPLRRLWHYLQISRHLVVCKWDAHPSREDLESEDGVMELITNLLHHGHNNGAFSIAEACNLDLRVVHGLWASRTTHLLNLGLFEEAANTLSTLPRERVQGILSAVLETVECTPIAVGFRALYANGSYKVKQFQPPAVETPSAVAAATAAEVQSLMTQRRIGVRSLLSRFGASGDVMAYCVRSFDFASVFPIVVQLKKDDEAFIKDVYQPVSDMDAIDAFRKAMLLFDPTLERMRTLLLAICKHLEARQEYAALLSWQEFMCDYARAGQTAVLVATLPSGDEKAASYAQRVVYLAKAEKCFIEGKFQPASKQAAPQHSESGVVLPVTRVDPQQLSQSLIQCRLQKDVWGLLHQHAPNGVDLVRFSLYHQVEQQCKVVMDLVLLGKHFFDVVVKIIAHLQLDIQHVYAPACLQLVRNKKADVVEQLCEFVKKSMVLGVGERNAVMHEAFVGCFHEYESSNKANKKAMKLCEVILESMTTEGGWKAKVLIKLKRWPEALNEALASKDKQVILDLYEKVSAAPQDEETAHVANAARSYLARNNYRI